MIYVANAALGGSKKQKPIQDEFQAQAAFANMFGKGSVQSMGEQDIFKGLEETFKTLDSK